MARGEDSYDSPFGVIYSTYMERPGLSRLIGRLVWGGDSKSYYDSMSAIGEIADGGTIVDCPCGAGRSGCDRHSTARLVGSCFVRETDTLRQRLLVRPGSGDFGR